MLGEHMLARAAGIEIDPQQHGDEVGMFERMFEKTQDAVLARQVEASAGAGLNNCYPARDEWQLRNRLSFSGALGTGFQVQNS
jgi:hypothetical protein